MSAQFVCQGRQDRHVAIMAALSKTPLLRAILYRKPFRACQYIFRPRRFRSSVPLCHAKKCRITIELVTTNALGTSQRAVFRILAASLRRSFR
jgi:hypothetical protein